MSDCKSYVSKEDLQALKESQQHIEHVARSRNAAGEKALQVTDRIRDENVTNRTLDGLEDLYNDSIVAFESRGDQTIVNLGWVTMDSFQQGAELTERNQVLRDETNGEYYRWDGSLPKNVPVGSTPDSAGGVGIGKWLSIGDSSIRNSLNPFSRVVSDFVTDQNKIVSENTNDLHIITFNIYQGDTIVNRFNGDFTSMERVAELQKYILKMKPDLIGIQEFYSLYEADINSYKFYPLNNGFFGKADALNNNRQYGNSLLSKFPLINPTNTIFTSPPSSADGEKRGFIRSKIIFKGVNIHIFNTHLSIDEPRAKAMITELANIIQDENISEPVILMGDWNISSDEAFLPLTNIGFQRANDNRYDTANNDGVFSMYIDDILFRGVSLKDQGTYDIPVSVSDHKPFFSIFEVL